MGRALVFVHKKGSKDKFRKYGNKSCTLNKVSSKVTGFWSSPFRAHLQALRLRVERGGGVCQLPRLWTLTCPCCICCSRSGEGGSWRSGFLSSGFPAQLLKEHYLLQDYKSQEILDRCTLLKAGDKTQLCFLSWQGGRWRAQTEEEREEGLILSTYLCRRTEFLARELSARIGIFFIPLALTLQFFLLCQPGTAVCYWKRKLWQTGGASGEFK